MKRDKYGNISSGMPRHTGGIYGNRGLGGPVGVSPMAAPKSISRLKSKVTGMKSYSRRSRDRLSGRGQIRYHNPLLTQDRVHQVFGFNMDSTYDSMDDESDISEYEYQIGEADLVPENYQYELDLVNVDQLEGEHRRMISKYQRAIEYMGAQALLWEDLMADLAENPHLDEEFKKFQMLRKLSGGRL